jgi:voltage-gated potassium channel
MKYIPSLLMYFLRDRTAKRNFFLLLRFFLILGAIVAGYSIMFHALMLLEGREFSWITGLYWTLTVMSTLGFGDITFKGDLGLIFSIIVLLTGIVYLLVMLPFTFIQFFYAPWLKAQSQAKAPRELPEDTTGHVILTNLDPITANLVQKLVQHNYEYAIVVDDLQRALELHELGYRVVFGDYGDPETYRRLRIQNAALVVVTNDDMINTNITFTIRDVCKEVPIVTNADADHSLDILQIAGSTHVFQFMKLLGRSLGRRTIGVSMGANVIWRFDKLLIAEAPAMRTPLEGKTLAEIKLRERTGVTVVGIWERGNFKSPDPTSPINSTTVLVLAGLAEQLKNYDKLFAANGIGESTGIHTLILGGGRVGRAAAETLEMQRIAYRIIDKSHVLTKGVENYIEGNAADIGILHKAGIMDAQSVIITTHNDDINIYLTIYCRLLRSDIQIISRANNENTVSKLHRAGADLVMSYASMAANTIINLLTPYQVLFAVEGLSVFRVPVHEALAGKSLTENRIRELTGCSVASISRGGELILNPSPKMPLEEHDELILIGTAEAEKRFREKF